MRTLVIGGTGTVGSFVVRELLARGLAPRVLVRTPETQRALPRGAEGVLVDLSTPGALVQAFDGTEALFLATAPGPNETAHGLVAVQAARAAKVHRCVYVSHFRLEEGSAIPHFASKIPIERAIAGAGFESTILRATILFQNDVHLRDAIVQEGLYPTPIGSAGASLVDARDLADAAVEALLAAPASRAAATRTVPIVGPRAWTGPEIAALYAKHLGRPVRYAGDDLDGWAQRLRDTAPTFSIDDWRKMLEFVQHQGLRAGDAEVAETERAVGHRVRTFEAFVAELVAEWRQ